MVDIIQFLLLLLFQIRGFVFGRITFLSTFLITVNGVNHLINFFLELNRLLFVRMLRSWFACRFFIFSSSCRSCAACHLRKSFQDIFSFSSCRLPFVVLRFFLREIKESKRKDWVSNSRPLASFRHRSSALDNCSTMPLRPKLIPFLSSINFF